MLFPRVVRHAFFKALGSFLYLVLKSKRKIIYTNLDLVFKGKMDQKEKDRIGKGCFQNLLIEALSVIEVYFMSTKKLYKSIKTINTERIDALKKEGKPIIYIIYHYGNLELGGVALSSAAETLHIVQKATNPYIDAFVKRSREGHGLHTIHMEKAVRHLAIQLKKGGDISLVVDQSVNINDDSALAVTMFGEPTSHVTTASFLARKFDAVLVPLHIEQKDSMSCILHFKEPIKFTKTEDATADIAYLTQEQARVLEETILENPDPWFWCHRRWKDTHKDLYT